MREILLPTVLLALIPVATQAPLPDAARRAQLLVRAVEARYHSSRTLQATFLERYSEGRGHIRLESGTVYFSRPGRMRWEYEAPEKKTFLVDGRNVWFYVPADRTVTRVPVKQSDDWRTPLALLTGKARLSRLCGRIDLAPEVPAASANAVLRCLPRSGSSLARTSTPSAVALDPVASDGSFQELLLEVVPATGEIARVLVRESAGIEIEFRFANWQWNPTLPEVLFHFQAPRGIAIVSAPAELR
ncbi:MAG: outer membrane lipoprotein carrier protein LolA [Verrucomicrobiales bacterium]|nr:outer membrane lipoprotein carrier protein LolA [Verrucomicrobiales bacterium]